MVQRMLMLFSNRRNICLFNPILTNPEPSSLHFHLNLPKDQTSIQ